MIVLDNEPLSKVENTGFNNLIKKMKPKCNMPSRKYFMENIIPHVWRDKIQNSDWCAQRYCYFSPVSLSALQICRRSAQFWIVQAVERASTRPMISCCQFLLWRTSDWSSVNLIIIWKKKMNKNEILLLSTAASTCSIKLKRDKQIAAKKMHISPSNSFNMAANRSKFWIVCFRTANSKYDFLCGYML